MKKYICTVFTAWKSIVAPSVNTFTTPHKEIPRAELNREQHLKTFRMIGLVHFAESEKRTLNRTKDKKLRERRDY